jgi:hypothetical protein
MNDKSQRRYIDVHQGCDEDHVVLMESFSSADPSDDLLSDPNWHEGFELQLNRKEAKRVIEELEFKAQELWGSQWKTST